MRINLSVTDEELAQLYRIARWQEERIPGTTAKITAVAAACMRLGMSERMKMEKESAKDKKKG